MIFFNVKEVRKYLIEKGFVYTLRKPRVRIGKDIAVFGNYYKHETIGRVIIDLMVENVTDPKQLFQYFEFSGLRTTPEDWLDLAIKLSGTTLNLYRVDLISNKALNDYLNYSPREKMNDCEEARLRALKDGEYADFSSL